MSGWLKLSKADAARAMVRHHFAPCSTHREVFDRLRSVQFDPIAPVGCNHDLVVQSRLKGYRVGDWQKWAYQERLLYDGWDKQASLVPFEGWPLRRIFHTWYRARPNRIFDNHGHAVDAILKELADRGPLMPKECEFQERKPEWKDSWHGPNLSKQTLRALWHSGLVMTTGRKGGNHVYDLTERVLPKGLLQTPMVGEYEAVRELVLERHRAVGLLRPGASYEVWSFHVGAAIRKASIQDLIDSGNLVAVEVDGVAAHATPEFLAHLDLPETEARVSFIAPLDQFVWDRKMIAHIFGFDYIWEIYVPEAKRKWGYYVLPVLFGRDLVARVEFWCRKGVLEVRNWHWEATEPGQNFAPEFQRSLRDFMDYSLATALHIGPQIEPKARTLFEGCVDRSALVSNSASRSKQASL